jgi:hypothetical protein
MKTRVLVAILVTCTAISAADHEFDQIVKAIEAHYAVKPTHVPLLGLGNFFLKTARPAGVSGFRIAIFENLDEQGRDDFELDSFMDRLAGSNLHPVVQVHSRQSGESTYIYTGNPGKSTRMLIANIEHHEATVLEVKVEMEALLRLLRDPDHIVDALGVHHQEP